MDFKEKMDEILEKVKGDDSFGAKFKENPVKAVEELTGKDLPDEQIKEYDDNRPTVDDTETDLVIDYYRRFIYRMEYMMKVGKEKGFDLISIMGP